MATTLTTWAPRSSPPSAKAVKPTMTSTTTMSWTIRKPIAIRPWSSSSSRLSESSFTMMIVEEKVRATAT